MKTKLLCILTFLGLWAFELRAQDAVVSGRVSADDGSALPGVTVVEKGTTNGTITDLDGNYKLSISGGDALLVFSFIGMETQEIPVGNRAVIDVEMSEGSISLEEVVVTAVGIEREKKALGYSVENLSGDKVAQVSEPDPLRAIQGKIAGVNITGSSGAAGSATRITIRGNSSFLGNNQPLFIVDGVPYNNSEGTQIANGGFSQAGNQLSGGGAYTSRIADLDPNNIASMTVLKGAAAAALYGSRAANGVIVITTKTGSAGISRKGLEITYNSSFAFEEIANLPDYQNTYGTGTNFNYSQVNGSWGAPFVGAKDYASLTEIPHWYSGVPGFEDLNGTTVPYQAYPDNVRDFFDRGTVLDQSLAISGGNEKSVLTLVLSRTDNNGYVPESEFRRTNLSVGGKVQLDNGVRAGGNLSYTNSFQHTFQGGANNAVGNASAFGRTLYLGRNWDLHGQPYQNPATLGPAFFVGTAQADNPLWSVENAGIDTDVDRVVAGGNIGYDFNDWLSFDYKAGINTYSQYSKDYFRPGSRGAGGLGQIIEDNLDFEEIESTFLLSASPEINDKFSLRALVGHNVNQRTMRRQLYAGTGYVTFDIDDIDNTNNVIPAGGRFTRRRIFGVFGDVSLGYRDYLFLNLTGRNDWSSTLPQENRSFFYPAVSTSFILSDALNITSQNLNAIKLRASWSQVGNDTQPYQLNPIFLVNARTVNQGNGLPFTPTGGATVPGATLSDIARDPNLRPERTREIEVGANVLLFGERIGLDVALYDRETFDQIAPVSLPDVSGFQQLFTNFGRMSNRGIEIGLDVTPIQLDNGFRWNVYTTFTHNKNVVKELIDGTDEIIIRATFAGSVSAILRPGEEYGLIKGSVSARDDEGNLLIDPSNGQLISALNPEVIGNPNPDFIVGVTNSLSWKGFTLSAIVDWRQGGDLYSVTNLSLLGRGVTQDTEDREIMRVIPGVLGDPNTQEPLRDESGNKIPNNIQVEVNTLYFGNTFGINAQDEWAVWDGTVVRLREAALNYALPKSVLSKTPFGSASIGVTGRNLWYHAPNFPEASNFDPETSQFGNTNAQGFEFNAAPSVKRYGVNIKLTF